MARNIDKLANQATDREPAGERFEDSFLDDRPVAQWPAYLDETAKDIATGIGIGDTKLDRYNFPSEVGPLYRDGIVATTGETSALPAALDAFDDTDLGTAVFLLNRLSHQIESSETGLDDVPRAVTATLGKLLSDATETNATPRLSEEVNSSSDILIQMLSDPVVADQVEVILDRFDEVYDKGLLAKLDEPQMMTPLWTHQRDALSSWLEAGRRGYVDMATATGKTVLGLAAIASQFGALHPLDEGLEPEGGIEHGSSKSDVLIVAHNDLILEQWRREFDRHLNIPADRTKGRDDVDLCWGRVHFRTAGALINQDLLAYDLVLLDEAHHYANGSGWGQLLNQFDCDVLALSGSVDAGDGTASAVRERLESQIGPEITRYTLSEAQQDGVIPTFNWTVKYTGDSPSAEFVEVTEKAYTRFQEFQARRERGELRLDTDRRLRTFDDIRKFSHTTEGTALKQEDEQFRDFATTLFSRRTQRWNQSPAIDDVCDVVTQFENRNVVVLTNNNAQIGAIEAELTEQEGVDENRVFTVHRTDGSATQRDTVDAFDQPETPAVLIGTGNLLGEGVDIQHADVGVNMSTGAVNKQLIQRIGRVLRNPGKGKNATFVNIVRVPIERRAQVPAEDGQSLLEDVHQFVGLGARFENRPSFAIEPEADDGVETLLDDGADRIAALADEGTYHWPDSDAEQDQLQAVLNAVEDQLPDGVAAVLDTWSPDETASPERETVAPSTGDESSTSDDQPEPEAPTSSQSDIILQFVTADGAPLSNALVSLVGTGIATYGRTDESGRISFENVDSACIVGIHEHGTGIKTLELDPEGQQIDRTVVVGDGGVA
jgi:superfamily II DNA or RNA helicase